MRRGCLFLLIFICLISCAKKNGCSDTKALNYSQDAGDNNYIDDDCAYECSGIFYWDAATYFNFFQDSLSLYVDLYLDGTYIGSDSTSNYYSGGGISCNANYVNFMDTIYLESQYKRLKVIDQNGRVMFNQLHEISYGCRIYEVEY